MKRYFCLLLVFIFAALTGCATTQNTLDTSAISKIKQFKSTKKDVLQLLGEPSSKTTASNGLDIWGYASAGQTTGSRFGDALRTAAMSYSGNIYDKGFDTVQVQFKSDIVQSVTRSTLK